MLHPVSLTGQYGVVSDRAPHELPTNMWSDARNMRFINGSAERLAGYSQVFGDPDFPPHFAINVRNDTTNYWLYAGEKKASVWDGGVHTNVTRETGGVDDDYAMSDFYGWHGTILSGTVILNNGVDAPQAWAPPGPGTKLTDLPNWPANTTARSIRAFKQFLIALDVTKAGSRYPHMVKWSHPADPGSVPSSWDETDPTLLAGESPRLSETQGFAVDGLPLGDTFIVYKEDSVWGMQLLQSSEVFRIYKIFDTGGIMSTNCVSQFDNRRHAVFGMNDIYQHDGQQMQSIVTERAKRRVFNSINTDHYRKCHTIYNRVAREVWFCYPTGDAAYCTEALVWNYETDTLGFRDLPNTRYTTEGIINSAVGSDQWGQDTQIWADDTTLWNERLYNPIEFRLMTASPLDEKLYAIGVGNSHNGVPMVAKLERIGLALPAVSNQPPDMTYRKFVRRIWPRVEGTPGGVIYVQVGSQEDNYSSVVWREPRPYVIGQSYGVDCRVAGRLLALRFYSDSILAWRLHGYEVEYELAGRY